MKPRHGLNLILNRCSFEAKFLVISHPLSTAHGYMSDVLSLGSVSGQALREPSSHPSSIDLKLA